MSTEKLNEEYFKKICLQENQKFMKYKYTNYFSCILIKRHGTHFSELKNT